MGFKEPRLDIVRYIISEGSENGLDLEREAANHARA